MGVALCANDVADADVDVVGTSVDWTLKGVLTALHAVGAMALVIGFKIDWTKVFQPLSASKVQLTE